MAEGVDFDRHYGRAVLLLGVPFQYTLGRVLRARLEYLRDTCGINEADFLTFDAIRQAAQCAGRVIRGKNDYGLVIFADARCDQYSPLYPAPPHPISRHFVVGNTGNLTARSCGWRGPAFHSALARPSHSHPRPTSTIPPALSLFPLAPLLAPRYNKQDKRSKLPAWIQQFMSDSYSNLSTDVAMASARQFLRQMAQPLGAHHHDSLDPEPKPMTQTRLETRPKPDAEPQPGRAAQPSHSRARPRP